ncbi:hypothetical protein EZL74_08495 [Flavobacterium silvisoli]|uniref:Uncharacterized protein n=1 Tax=Flavobacterium silvisoli TaxID=2529433 RepID=A0A4Q9YX10_9FLAO|nr:hypothetical protein [Flavobacterium silvisoli]TBX68340.1 hypothetical protein EZL74_08495 [Flavobacterium silvisoli]
MPANSANPYDEAGRVYYELIRSYYSESYQPLSYSGIIGTLTTLANAQPSFLALTTQKPYVFAAEERSAYLVSQSGNCLDEVIATSLSSADARSSLKQFVTTLMDLSSTEEEYSGLYEFIATYEDAVLADGQLSGYEQNVILTATSIARYTVYAKKKKPKKNTDPDWTLLIGNITAAIDGAAVGIDEAVMRAAVVGIVENMP